MAYEVEFTGEFEAWWISLTADEQESVAFSVRLLEEQEIHLKRPHADAIHGSKYVNLRELRCQHEGRPYHVLYAFDPRRIAMLLIGGDKTGNPSWYEEFVPKAERIYAQHLKESTYRAWRRGFTTRGEDTWLEISRSFTQKWIRSAGLGLKHGFKRP